MEQILAHGHVIRGWVGFMPQDLTEEQAARVGAAVVVDQGAASAVPPTTPGIQPNDLIISLNGEPVRSAQELVSRLAALKPGVDVQIEGRRGREPFKVEDEGGRAAHPAGAPQQHSSQAERQGVRLICAPSCSSFSSMAS